MKNMILVLAVQLWVGLALAGGPTAVTGGGVQGTWTRTGSPYQIYGDVEVPSGSKLRIERDAQVIFEGDYSLSVYGTLEVIGESDDHVIFAAGDEGEGEWRGLRFIKAEEHCRMQNFVITDVVTDEGQGGAIYSEGTELRLTNFAITECRSEGHGAAMYLIGGSAVLTNGAVSDNECEGDHAVIYAQQADVAMTNMAVADNIGIGIFLARGSEGVLTNIAVSDQSGEFGWGIFVAGSKLMLTNGAVGENEAGGIRLKAESSATLTTCAISGPNALKQDESSDVNMVLTAVSDD